MHAELVLVVIICWQVQQPQASSRGDATSESVDVRYARAQLQLAEANLKRLEKSNERMPRSVPSSVVAEYQYDVQVAKSRLERATAGRAASEFGVWLQRADAERRTAETAWKSALAANARAPGTFQPLDVERFQLRTEVARLQLERGRALVDAGREAQLQWQIELLENQHQRLKEETSRATSFIGFYPVWGW
jgi:hypothetical protein